MHKTSQAVLDHGSNNVKIKIARSNLLTMGFFTCVVFSWCALVDYFNTLIVIRPSNLKFDQKNMVDFWEKLSLNVTILSSKIVADGSIGGGS